MLFDDNFMNDFKNAWNTDDTIPSTLSKINFSANVGYGFQDEPNPKAVLIIKDGTATEARAYNGESLDWDIRCTKENWDYYLKNGLGLTGLGSAYTMGWMKFLKGDYFSMIKNPSMIGPFLKSFQVMGSVYKNNENL